MDNWSINEENYFIEVYDTEDAGEYTEIEIGDMAYTFKIANELENAGKIIRVRRETYYE